MPRTVPASFLRAQAPKPLECAAVFLLKADDLLGPTRGTWVCHRLGTQFGLQGYLQGPGGKVDPGESPRQAAQRELLEEAGLQVALSDFSFQGAKPYTCGGVESIQHLFFVYLTAEVVPVWREPAKHGPWIYKTLTSLSALRVVPTVEYALSILDQEPARIEMPWERPDGGSINKNLEETLEKNQEE